MSRKSNNAQASVLEMHERFCELLEMVAHTRNSFDYPDMDFLEQSYKQLADYALVLCGENASLMFQYEFRMLQERMNHIDG